MSEATTESRKDSFLNRPISSWLRLDGWVLLVGAILLLAVGTRLWDLGARSYNHDEAIHAWESWKLYTGQGYTHSPVYHGPFLYHFTALVYFLFGVSDFTGRLGAAIFGILSVGAIYYFRRWLGRTGTIVAMALAVISPALLYYGRFIRHDAFSVFFTLLMALGTLNYLEKRENKYLYLTILGMALYFANMETAFIQSFVFFTFVGGVLIVQKVRNPGMGWREFPAFDLIMAMGTLILPLTSPLATKAISIIAKDPTISSLDYTSAAGIIRSAIIWVIFFAASMVVGLWWDRRRWPVIAGIFYAIYVVLFTTFFTNGQGLATGQVGSLGYWLSQQDVKRGNQPWFYYLVLMPLYEYLPVLFGIIGGAFYVFRRRKPAEAETQVSDPRRGEPAPFVPFVMWWSVANFVIFSWGGEKMPWLLVHLTLPAILLTGWFMGELLHADWRGLYKRGGGWVALLLPLAVIAIVGAMGAKPFRGTTTQDLNATMRWIGAFVLLLIAGVPLLRFGSELGWRSTGRIAMVVVFVFLAAFTVHNSWMAVFKNGDVAVETLIYAQGSPDDPRVMDELKSMSLRLHTGEKDLKVAYDDESSWPFVWYLRDWPNAQFYGKTPSNPLDAEVVLVGSANEAAVKPFLGNRYYRRQYRLVWWPDEDYKELTPAKIWKDLTSTEGRKKLWDIIMYRKYDEQLAAWPLVNNFAMYVRKDVASQLWDYGPETLASAEQTTSDDYTTQFRTLNASLTIGTMGEGNGQLQEPKGVAVDASGRILVADSKNNRVVIFDASGAPVGTIGSTGNGPGQMTEPWGVAVGPDGSIYVADTWNHRVEKFDKDGKFLLSWGTYGDAGGKATAQSNIFYGPRGIAVDGKGNVWVTDTGNKRVVKFDANGNVLGQYGGVGSNDGQFLEPVGIAVDSRGNVYVADTWNRRVQVFDADFKYLRQFAIEGWEGQSVVNKPFLAVDATDAVYVTDPEVFRVIKFSSTGKVLAVWGKRGNDLGSFNLPTGIVVGAQGQVIVSDSSNGRLMQFAAVQ